ncbi:FAD-binding oxidoreductase [Kutzneria sp. 744]|uniref:FAD-binding oxidoreductase n=1 Tax=Kutzneria sp. (strain 744) TaxID=345341 RepID=UPI0003EEDE0D|nr:FAD-binding protein [Kutzneria sp. 744]EWM18642.1 oxidoreductase, FAD-dependent [Kutzneria sp. 744]
MLSRRSLLRASAAAVVAAGVGLPAAAATGPRVAGKWDALSAGFDGELVLPSDSDYELAKQLHIAEYDAIRPQAIAYCQTQSDVRNCVLFARAQNVPVRVRSGGHNYHGWSTGDGLVIDVSRFDQATITGSTVHLGPGTKAIDAVSVLGQHNIQVVEGTCPTVCGGGFISGGGVGYETRKYGLGADRVVSATIVLADGRVIKASDTREPDLFWAMRGGGGGNFGVVLDWEVLPIPQPTAVQFTVSWPVDVAAELFAAWQQAQATGPRDLGSAFVLALPNAAPGATPNLFVTGLYLGAEADLKAVIAEMSSAAGAQPTSSSMTELSYDKSLQASYNCDALTVAQCHTVGQNPVAVLPRTGLQRESYRMFNRVMSSSDINDMLTAWDNGRRAGQFRVLHCIGLGGALADHTTDAIAFPHRDALFVGGFVAQYDKPTAQDITAAESWLADGTVVLDRLASGAYVNFVSSVLPNWRQMYYGGNYPRLTDVKHHYDPTNFFRYPRSIGS